MPATWTVRGPVVASSGTHREMEESLQPGMGKLRDLRALRENDNNGLYYYRARYYMPRLGKFISEDPLGLSGHTVNLYEYAYDNFTNLVDPSGEQSIMLLEDPIIIDPNLLGEATDIAAPKLSLPKPDGGRLEEVDNSGNVLARYTAGGIDEPFAELRSGTTSYYQEDGLDSVTSLTNSAGALANTYSHDSFGKLTASAGTLTNPFQYTAREFDQETGIYFYRARYYDQTSGRFLSEDPLEFGGDGANFYAYTLNNPVNYVDPMGTSSQGPPPPPTPGPPGPAQLGGFIYNHPPPQTGLLGGDALAFANCMGKCLARYFVVTGGSECTPDGRHVPGGVKGSRHCTNQAVDIRPTGHDQHDVFCCALNCGAEYIQNEGDHWHIQLTPGRNGGHGLLPKPCDCK
jgi:RHS repeat-associated protein